MEQITVSSVVNTFRNLPFPEKEYTLEILQKQMIEEKRVLFARRIKEARMNYKTGKVKKGSLKELLKDLAGA
jgi:hypothetical protein